MDAPTILRPVRAKAHVCCDALTGRKKKHMAIPQGVALGYKIKGFQPTRHYHVNEYAERKPCSSATPLNYHLMYLLYLSKKRLNAPHFINPFSKTRMPSSAQEIPNKTSIR